MDEPLVDESGFPRDDIDLVAVRTARSKLICGLTLRNQKFSSHILMILVNSLTK